MQSQYCSARTRQKSNVLSALVLMTFGVAHDAVAMAGTVEPRLNGAWAESDESCKKAFVGASGKLKFREPRDMYGSSFIVSGRRYEGPFGVCNLSSVTPKGEKLSLALSCHNSVGYSDQVTSVQLNSDTELIVFSSMDGLQITYKKCVR